MITCTGCKGKRYTGCKVRDIPYASSRLKYLQGISVEVGAVWVWASAQAVRVWASAQVVLAWESKGSRMQ
jgi:hypothetical protein